jgi:hypothetical protein
MARVYHYVRLLGVPQSETSGAKALVHFQWLNGTNKLVPFPFVMNSDFFAAFSVGAFPFREVFRVSAPVPPFPFRAICDRLW